MASSGLRTLALATAVIVTVALGSHATRRALAEPAPVTAILVVVNPDGPLRSLGVDDLRSIYLGETTSAGDDTLHPTLRPTGMKERDLFFRRGLGMTERDYRQHWVARIYRGDATSSPSVVASDEALRRYVKANRGAIGFLRDGAATDGVRVVLRIDQPR